MKRGELTFLGKKLIISLELSYHSSSILYFLLKQLHLSSFLLLPSLFYLQTKHFSSWKKFLPPPFFILSS